MGDAETLWFPSVAKQQFASLGRGQLSAHWRTYLVYRDRFRTQVRSASKNRDGQQFLDFDLNEIDSLRIVEVELAQVWFELKVPEVKQRLRRVVIHEVA